MNYFDILIIVPLAWGAYKGFKKGLIIELASLLALILGIYAGINFSNYVSDLLIKWFELTTKYLPVISFVITFILVVIGVYSLAKLLEKFVDLVSLSFINKLAGALFSMSKYLLIVSVVLIVFNKFDPNSSFISKETKETSLLYNPVSRLSELIAPKLSFPQIEQLKNNALKEKSNENLK